MILALRIANQQLLELRRQPAMIAAMAAVVSSIAGLVLFVALTLTLVNSQPASRELFQANLATAGFGLEDPIPFVIETLLSSFNFLLFTQLLGMTAVLAGQSIVHERQSGTLAFLMLAPVRRGDVLLGKALGAAILPIILYGLIGGSSSLVLASLELTEAYAWRLPPSPGWLIAFWLGGPAWCLALAAAGTLLSIRSRDVRTAQQGVWLLVFLASTTVGAGLGGGLQEDAGFQLVLAGAGVICTLGLLALGTLLLRRDIHL